ncbi:hypothetical protein PG997_013806 [Apiospora hydei]|uniref:Fucose-specific lectin n=1 Tax=Apiospora hydei TaxID=1337664 RepID=A0ABR1V783_9PEZI
MPGETIRSDQTPYSTLEVSYPDPQDKTVVPAANEKIPNTSHDGNRALGLDSSGSNGQNSLEAVLKDDAKVPPRRNRTRCGLSPIAFWVLIAALILLVLGAIVGGIAAAVLRRDPKSPSKNGPSQLSAVNWTDSSNQQRMTVFYQRNGKLWLSQKDASSASWTDLDIESRLSPPAAGEDAVKLNPKKGTPLAAVVAPAPAGGHASIYLYYLDTGDNIRDIHSTSSDDTAKSTWTPGDLWENMTLSAAPNTGLAALAHYCPVGCLNQNMVVFQITEGSLYWADGRNWSNRSRIVSANAATNLAMYPSLRRNESTGKMNPTRRTEARLYYHRDGRIDEFIFNEKEKFGWIPGTVGIFDNVPNAQRSPGLAAAPAAVNAQGLVLTLRHAEGGGNVTASYLPATGQWDANQPQTPPHRNLATSFDDDESMGAVTENKPAGAPLAAVALAPDGLLYVLSLGDDSSFSVSIRQYSVSDARPDTFRFSGRVL